MPQTDKDRCAECKAELEWRFAPALGRSLAFDVTTVDRSGDPLARWAEYRDRRTGALFAYKLRPGEQPAPDEEQIRLHAVVHAATTNATDPA